PARAGPFWDQPQSARRPAAVSSRAPPSDEARPTGAPQARSVFSQNVLQRRNVQHSFRKKFLQPAVLVFHAFQLLSVRGRHPAISGLPAIKRLLADPMPPADLGS